jgi:sec-independent protein translocase protein TatA
VGRYLGKGIVEFKKGIKGVEDDIDTQGGAYGGYQPPPEPPKPPQKMGPSAPKFEDPSTDSEGKPRY